MKGTKQTARRTAPAVPHDTETRGELIDRANASESDERDPATFEEWVEEFWRARRDGNARRLERALTNIRAIAPTWGGAIA